MSLKQQTIAIAAAAFFVAAGSVSVSAQENCGFMYQRVMEAYQVQSPHYGQMLNHYNARSLRCLGRTELGWRSSTPL